MGAKRGKGKQDEGSQRRGEPRAPVDSSFLLDLPKPALPPAVGKLPSLLPIPERTEKRSALGKHQQQASKSPSSATGARQAVRAQPLSSLGPKPLPRTWEQDAPEWDDNAVTSWETGTHRAAGEPRGRKGRQADDALTVKASAKHPAAKPDSAKYPTLARQTAERRAISPTDVLRQQAVDVLGDDALTTSHAKVRGTAKVAVVKPDTGIVRVPATMRQSAFDVAHAATSARKKRPVLFMAITIAIVLSAALAGLTSEVRGSGAGVGDAWKTLAGVISFNGPPDPPSAPQSLDPQHYMDRYGFFKPASTTAITGDERTRLIAALPKMIRATGAFDFRYHQKIEPQLVAFWSHSEGIQERINYSNCANQSPANGYFQTIQNCDTPNFWQLGYGNQFSEIYVLKNAFTDLYGDPNDKIAVQKVGQWVLDFDKSQGTTPACGGYSCTFPTMSIDEIMSGVDMRTGHATQDNWWASVLSRDPGINSYMIAEALQWFNHQATQRWVGCYYATACWQRESDRLGDILVSWPDLAAAAGIKG